MLESQKNYANYLKQLDDLLKGTDFSTDPVLFEKIMQTEMVVPVIGAFSAGKSSLLNAFMDKKVLPVGIAPETELATELRYASEPCLVAIHTSGEEEHLPVEALATINRRSGELSHLRLYLDSEPLKAIAPLVLVDMPGYGSSLDSHNRALAFYLPRGVHFVVVTSIEDGTITQSMVRRLDEVKTYAAEFTFVLSKCNLKPAEQLSEVKTYVDEQLAIYFDGSHKAIAIGRDDVTSFAKALEAIDPDALFVRQFDAHLKHQHQELLHSVNLAIRAAKLDAGQSEQSLRDLEQALAGLLAQQEDMQAQVSSRYSRRLLDRCLRAIDGDLNQSLEELAGLALSGNSNALSNTVSEIVRGSLTRTISTELDGISAEMVGDLAAGLAAANGKMAILSPGQGWADDLAGRVKSSLELTNRMLGGLAERIGGVDKDKAGGYLYKAISTVLAVTTGVVAPVLELVIIFLPEILRAVNAVREQQNIRVKLQNELIPGIKAELRATLPAILDEQLAAMLAKVNEGFEEQIRNQRDIIAASRQQGEAHQAETAARIKALEELSGAMKALATQYLFA